MTYSDAIGFLYSLRWFGAKFGLANTLTAANTLTRNMHSRMAFTIEVGSLDVLKRALSYVRDVKGVLGASRR